MVMPVSYLNTLEPVLAPYPQRASAGIAELSDRIGGVSFAFEYRSTALSRCSLLYFAIGGSPPGRGIQENVTTSKSQTTIRRIL